MARTLRPPEVGVPPVGGDSTIGQFMPNAEQTLLLQALAGPLVKNPGAGMDEVPSVRDLEGTLGWSQKKINTKIDYLCRTLENNGLPGFSARSGNAPTRRLALARYALENYWSLTHRGVF